MTNPKATPKRSTQQPTSARANVKTVASPTPDWLQEQVRTNIRVLKSIRGMSDEQIAEKAGFTNRQVFSNRLGGRTDFTTEDYARIAAALHVEPHVLMMKLDDMFSWVQNNPNYKPPRYRKQNGNPRKNHRTTQ